MNLDPNKDVFSTELVCWERGQHGGRTRPIDRDVLFKNLVDIHKVFQKYEIRHWLSHGTILGVYREANFIEWDDDADIGMDFRQRDTKKYDRALKTLIKKGFYIPPSNPEEPIGKDNAPYYDFVAIKDGEKVEGWFFEKKDDFYIYDEPRCGNALKHPAKYYDELGTIDFNGIEFNCPNHIEEWLVMMYGEDWKIPNKEKKYNIQS